MVEESDEIKNLLKSVNKKFPLRFAVLFGSRARGDELVDSDYDILLISDSFEGMDIFQRINAIISMTKLSVEPVCFTEKEFKENLKRYNAIVWMSLKEGIPVFGEENFRHYKENFLRYAREGKIDLSRTVKFLVEPEELVF